jgi:hypothetical protein
VTSQPAASPTSPASPSKVDDVRIRYIRKFGQQSVFEKLSSNVVRNAHSQFDILMGIAQAHILSFGASSVAEDAASIASSVRTNALQTFSYLIFCTCASWPGKTVC